MAQEAARRVDDRLRLEASRGDLVQEREEGVVVARVEPEHVLAGARQDPKRTQPGESRAEHHDTWTWRRHHDGSCTVALTLAEAVV
jgi:hypothetical protein